MRRAALALLATVIGLVLLLGFKTASGGNSDRPAAIAPATTGPSAKGTTSPVPTTSPTRSKSAAGSTGTRTFDGATVNTPYGPVQVRITKTNGKLTDIAALQLPNADPQSQQIASYAAPLLRSEALKAGSAKIDIISGATYDSQGYAQSLQAALDAGNG
jgi:uncharacterized protein with FMN-binding domain